MGYTANVEDYLSLEKCKHSGLYRIYARNFSLGVYNLKEQGFIGIRRKFTMVFLDLEYHWDTGEPYGTAKPYEFLEFCPLFVGEKNDKLMEWLKEKNKHYL
jgi:hypothetical protein